MKEGKRPVREVSTDSIQVGSWEAWAPAPRSPPQEQIQKSGSIFPTHKLKVGATQQGRPVQKKKKKALSSPTPGRSSTLRFLCGSKRFPRNRTDFRGARLSSRFHPAGHRRWGPSRRARGPRRGGLRAARSVEKMPVLGTEDWDFVGQLN